MITPSKFSAVMSRVAARNVGQSTVSSDPAATVIASSAPEELWEKGRGWQGRLVTAIISQRGEE